jgi:hypothetical protein
MLVVEFFTWWYGRGFIELFKRFGSLLSSVWQRFSVLILLKTLFAPWRRITTEGGRSIQERSRALVDNLVSRLVGFTIRFFVIIAALISELLLGVIGLVVLIVWPLAPPLVVLSVIGVVL